MLGKLGLIDIKTVLEHHHTKTPAKTGRIHVYYRHSRKFFALYYKCFIKFALNLAKRSHRR